MHTIFGFSITLSEILLFTHRTLYSLNLFYIPVISGHLAFDGVKTLFNKLRVTARVVCCHSECPFHLYSLVQYKPYVRQYGWNMTINKNVCTIHVHWGIYTLFTLHLVIVHKMSDKIQLNILRPSVLLLRLKSMSALVCSGGQQCDVPSNEIVWLKVFAWIDCVLMEKFVQLTLQLFCVGKKRVKMQKFSFNISMR